LFFVFVLHSFLLESLILPIQQPLPEAPYPFSRFRLRQRYPFMVDEQTSARHHRSPLKCSNQASPQKGDGWISCSGSRNSHVRTFLCREFSPLRGLCFVASLLPRTTRGLIVPNEYCAVMVKLHGVKLLRGDFHGLYANCSNRILCR
jgi:hypothetical protein